MLDCRGVVRIDYMLDGESNTPYVCEINTIPGSFAFYLFEPMGISFKQLTNRLIAVSYTHLSTHGTRLRVASNGRKLAGVLCALVRR